MQTATRVYTQKDKYANRFFKCFNNGIIFGAINGAGVFTKEN